jgi:hypothetical protein
MGMATLRRKQRPLPVLLFIAFWTVQSMHAFHCYLFETETAHIALVMVIQSGVLCSSPFTTQFLLKFYCMDMSV